MGKLLVVIFVCAVIEQNVGAVAFYAERENNQILSLNERVIWDRQYVDTDNAYSTSSGVFTAPSDGLYFFGVYFQSFKNKSLRLAIRKNGSTNGSGFARNGSGSILVVFKLNTGDTVDVIHTVPMVQKILGNWSRFVDFSL